MDVLVEAVGSAALTGMREETKDSRFLLRKGGQVRQYAFNFIIFKFFYLSIFDLQLFLVTLTPR